MWNFYSYRDDFSDVTESRNPVYVLHSWQNPKLSYTTGTWAIIGYTVSKTEHLALFTLLSSIGMMLCNRYFKWSGPSWCTFYCTMWKYNVAWQYPNWVIITNGTMILMHVCQNVMPRLPSPKTHPASKQHRGKDHLSPECAADYKTSEKEIQTKIFEISETCHPKITSNGILFNQPRPRWKCHRMGGLSGWNSLMKPYLIYSL